MSLADSVGSIQGTHPAGTQPTPQSIEPSIQSKVTASRCDSLVTRVKVPDEFTLYASWV